MSVTVAFSGSVTVSGLLLYQMLMFILIIEWWNLLLMEAVMFSSEECDSPGSSHIRHYKIASELKKYSQSRNNLKCFRIPESQADLSEQQTNNIFECAEIERAPQSFVETAKEYEVVGYKYIKARNRKKGKRKLNRKNTESASSRHSKNSSSLPSLDRGIVTKEILLERVRKIEEKENRTPSISTRLVQSKILLDSFEKSWQQQIKRGGERLQRKPAESLLNLSEAFRGKIQRLEDFRLNELKNNPRPEVWEKTLCDGRSFKHPSTKDAPESVGKMTNYSRNTNKFPNYWKDSAPFIEIIGKSKLKQEAAWLSRSPHKLFFPDTKVKM